VGPNEGEFFILARFVDGLAKGGVQFRAIGEGARFGGAGRDPGRMLEDWADDPDELHALHGI
jgi:hypothetical protein